MRKFTYLKAILFIFIVSLCITSLIVNAQATSWSKVPSPTKSTLESVDMISSSDGWVVRADGTIYRWQEEAPDVPIVYPIIIGAVVVVVVVWFFLRKRSLKKKSL